MVFEKVIVPVGEFCARMYLVQTLDTSVIGSTVTYTYTAYHDAAPWCKYNPHSDYSGL